MLPIFLVSNDRKLVVRIREIRMNMVFLKLLLHISLGLPIVIAITTDVDSPYCPYDPRLPSNIVEPLQYDIMLTPYINTFGGKSTYKINIHYATESISLHAYKLVIDGYATRLTSEKGMTYVPSNHNYCNKTHILIIKFPQKLTPGQYILNMKFTGFLSDDIGFIKIKYTDEHDDQRWLYITVFEPIGARKTFPCWDEPAMKATFNISILHLSKYTAASNMPLKGTKHEEHGTVQTQFHTTPMMSTYLVAIAVVDFDDFVHVSNLYKSISMWCRRQVVVQLKFAEHMTERITQFLVWYTRRSGILPSMSYLVLPDENSPINNVMGSWGFVTCREQDLTVDEKFDVIGRKVDVSLAVAHEVARQWFESLISPSWWNHVWLNRALALFFRYYAYNEISRDERIMDLFVVQIQQPILHNDIAMHAVSISSEIDPFYMPFIYTKGSAIMRMSQHIVRKDVFRETVVQYLNVYQYNAATSNDFWYCLQRNLYELEGHFDYNLEKAMDTWLSQRHYPTVIIKRDNETGEIICSQEPFYSQNSSNEKWWIPITFTTQSTLNFDNTIPIHWLHNDDIRLDGVERDDWIIVNLQQTGYYRVNYDKESWLKIADYLNFGDYTKIHVLNRAQLIDDAYHFLMEDQLDYSVFLYLTKYLQRETDYIPWYSMMNILSYMSNFFKFEESMSFKIHVVTILDGFLENIGYKEDSDDDDIMKAKRLLALRWACKLGHAKCRWMTTTKLDKHLTDPEKHIIPPLWKDWVYCTGMIAADSNTWQKIVNKYMRTDDAEILKYLSCANEELVTLHYLNAILTNPNNVWNSIKSEQHNEIYNSFIKKHIRENNVLSTILIFFEELTPSEIPVFHRLINIIMNIYSEEQAYKIRNFMKHTSGINVKMIDELDELMTWRLNQLNRQRDYFAKRFKGDKIINLPDEISMIMFAD